MRFRLVCVVLFGLLSVTATPTLAAVKSTDDLTPEEKKKLETDFWAYFSGGLLVNFFPESLPSLGESLVNEAEIRGTTVRVKSVPAATATFGLQAFVPVWSGGSNLVDPTTDSVTKLSEWGVGPYVGVGLGSESLIETVALGVAWSYRRKEIGIRIGLGAVADPSARFLSPEFAPGAAVPAGAETIEFIERPTGGVQLMLSFTPGF